MSNELLVVIIAGVTMAWANGSNDVSKGIATLVGAGVTNYRTAILWGVTFTAIGALAGSYLAHAMVETFGSKLLTATANPDLKIAVAIIGGTAGWVLLSTRTGLPVSTTHAIVGSVVGVALVAFGSTGVDWTTMIWKVAFSLTVSPLVALVITMMLRRLWERNAASGFLSYDKGQMTLAPEAAMAQHMTSDAMGNIQHCLGPISSAKAQDTSMVRKKSVTVDRIHWMSAGLASFARGMNDAPKLAGLMFGAVLLSGGAIMEEFTVFIVIALAMAAGGLMAGRRITKVLAEDVTVMNHQEGLTANFVTSMLVTSGAVFGLPMSTTHVSSSSLIGIGASGEEGKLHWGTVKVLLAAWIITMPGAALFGIILFWLGKHVAP